MIHETIGRGPVNFPRVFRSLAIVDYESLNGHILSKLLDTGQKISAEMGYSGAYVVAV